MDIELLIIQQIIERNACGIEGFFTDSKKAAAEIVKYLQSERKCIEVNVKKLENAA